ncbi:MAG: hypothetical protein WD472_08260 [Dehalococcoidia bacterium]
MSASSSQYVRFSLLCALLVAALAWPADRARAQVPLAPVTGLEVIGELRPGTPNIPLLLVVQWNPVPQAERYEVERAEPAATPDQRVFVPVASVTVEDRQPGRPVRHVDEAGFATAGGDCFRVRAVRGEEVTEWAETCVPVPPQTGGPQNPDFGFAVELTSDYELTVIGWRAQAGFYGPFDISEQGGLLSPLAMVLVIPGPISMELVLPRYGGCFRLETAGVSPVSYGCRSYPTDMQPPALLELVQDVPELVVLESGRTEAPIVVAWPAQGGLEATFRVERLTTFGEFEIVTLARRATLFQGWRSATQVFLDPAPNGEQCYRVTQISYVGESVIGEACLGDEVPGPPDAGTGFERTSREGDTRWTAVGMALLLIAGSMRRRTTR